MRNRRPLVIGAIVVIVLIVAVVLVISQNQNAPPKSVAIAMSINDRESFGAGMEYAARLAWEEHNGMAGNLPVELLVYRLSDPAVNPDNLNPFSREIEISIVERVIDNPNVVAYIGPVTSGQAIATIPLTNAAGLAQISVSASWPGLTLAGFGAGEPGIYYPTGQRNFFRVTSNDSLQGVVATAWAYDLGFREVYLLGDDTRYSIGLAGVFEANAADAGIEIVGKETYDSTVLPPVGVDEIIARVIASGADLLYFPVGSDSQPYRRDIIIGLRAAAPEIAIMGGDAFANSDFDGEIPVDALEGVWATDIAVPASALSSDAATALTARYEADLGTPLTSSFATGGYEVVNMLFAAIQQAETKDRAGVLTALHNIEYSGVYGTWHFDANGDMSPATIAGFQVLDGEWTFLTTLTTER